MSGTAKYDRRALMRNSGLGALAFTVGTRVQWLTPRQAHARDVAFNQLDAADAALLTSFGEHLLPGAASAGLTHFVDQQLGVDPQDCLLMCKYFPHINAPYRDFYRDGLTALRDAALALNSAGFDALSETQKNALTDSLWGASVAAWSGPPPPLFYMSVRSDAVDVVYGTEQGFDTLKVPYMPHIRPPRAW